MFPSRHIDRHLNAHLMPILGLGFMAVSIGCVEPDKDRPWSTRHQSVSGFSEQPDPTPQANRSSEAHQPSGAIERSIEVASISSEPDTPANISREDQDEPTVELRISTEEIVRPDENPNRSWTLDGDTSESRAISWLQQAVFDDYAMVRAYAFEAMEHRPPLLEAYAGNGLVDENRGVRFVTTMAIGRTCLGTLTPLIEPGLLDPSLSVKAATIYALRELGQPVDPSSLAAMTMGEDPEVRGNAYMVLGMLGNPTAVPVIDASLGQGMRLRNPMRIRITELQAAEALVMLGDQVEVEPIRAALFSPVEQGELTVLACDMLGRLQDEQARPMLMRLILAEGNERRPPEIRVAAANAILRLPPPHEDGLEKVILEYADAENPLLRTQVASALAAGPSPEARKTLDRLLGDENPIVRTAAAGALLERAAAASESPKGTFQSTTATVPD